MGGSGIGTGWLRLPDPETDLQSDAIRWVGGRFVLANDRVPPATAYSVGPEETLHLGQSPLYARSLVLANDAGFTISYTFFAAAGERKDTATRGFRYELRDASGALLGEGTTNAPYIGANAPRGAYRATVRAGGTELALSFDSTRTGFDPPVLTSLRILDGEGALATAVAPGEHATLAFTAEDVHASRGWWRTDGDWQPLAIPGPLPTNVFGPVDLRIELEDAGGNTAATTIEDAYSVGAKRRAMRR